MTDHSTPIAPRDKISTIDGLAKLAAKARADGKTVALAHGVFDLVHMGHVRHLEAAAKEADLLFVTVTADAHVNRGPGRPVFPEGMRAEMLASVQYVAAVAVSSAATAIGEIGQIKPDAYIKGSDYKNAEDDVTGMIVEERKATEAHGGRVVFTDEVTFSSSNLINSYFDVFDPPLRAYLDRAKASQMEQRISDVLEQVKDFKVLFVGDAIVDEYQYVTPMGKAPKEHMIAARFEEREVFAGGVFAAANHLAGICAQVDVISMIGGQQSEEQLIRNSMKPNVGLTLLERSEAPTTRKTRLIEPNYLRKLFEVYTMDDAQLSGVLLDQLNELILDRAPNYDLVIVADFGHGLIGPTTIAALRQSAKFLAVNTQTNSANLGYNLISRYPSADYVCIDAPEAQLASADKRSDIEDVITAKLPTMVDCHNFMVTHGQQGCVSYKTGSPPIRIPAFTKTVVDTVGAGDAFLAVTSPLVAAGADLEVAAFVGNAAGAMKVGIVGHRRTTEKAQLLKYVTTLLK